MMKPLTLGALAIASALVVSACTIGGDGPVLTSGDLTGEITTEERGLEGFTAVHMGGYAGLEVREGNEFSVDVTADSGIQDHVSAHVERDTLYVSQNYAFLGSAPDVTVTVTLPSLEGVELSGASVASIRASHPESLRVHSSGAAEIDIHANPTALDLDVSGAGRVTMHGTVDSARITVSGAGEVNGEDLTAGDAVVEVSGASNVTLRARDSLDAEASGASNIGYWGAPAVTSDASGASDIRRLGEE
jgi:hypothetical protein